MPERTKLYILNAFNKLVQKKSFDKITVDYLCREADVGRTTFYRYFTDKYDILDYSVQQTFRHAQEENDIRTFEDLFQFVGEQAVSYWRPLANLYDTTAIDTLHAAYVKYSEQFATEFIVAMRGNQPFTPEEKVQMRVICSGCSHLFEDYVKGKVEITPDRLAGAVYELVPDHFKGSYN